MHVHTAKDLPAHGKHGVRTAINGGRSCGIQPCSARCRFISAQGARASADNVCGVGVKRRTLTLAAEHTPTTSDWMRPCICMQRDGFTAEHGSHGHMMDSTKAGFQCPCRAAN